MNIYKWACFLIAFVLIVGIVSCAKDTYDTRNLNQLAKKTEAIYSKLIVIQQSNDKKENWYKTRNYFAKNIKKLIEEMENLSKPEKKPASEKDEQSIKYNQDKILLRQRINKLHDILKLLLSSVETSDFSYFDEIMEDGEIKKRIENLLVDNKKPEETLNIDNTAILNSLDSVSDLNILEQKSDL